MLEIDCAKICTMLQCGPTVARLVPIETRDYGDHCVNTIYRIEMGDRVASSTLGTGH